MVHEVPRLSPHLTIAEFLTTQHRDLIVEQWRIWSTTPNLLESGRRFAFTCFEPLRTLLDAPLHVNSGYRCPALNSRIGGAPQSLHMFALAADIIPIGVALDDVMAEVTRAMHLGQLPHIDKVIIECGTWIHVQGAHVGKIPRRLALKTDDTVHYSTYG